MIQICSLTHGISNQAHYAAFYAKKLCTHIKDIKVDRVFHATVGAIQAHPYIALLGTTIGVYCCRGQIKNLVTKVEKVARCLCAKTIESLKNITNLFKQSTTDSESLPLGGSGSTAHPPLLEN